MEESELIRKINENNRLLLTTKDFKLLNRYALAAKKTHRYFVNNKHLATYDVHELDRLQSKNDELLNQFYESFNNPFQLDMEFDSSGNSIYFEFYDYDYLYIVSKCKNGWNVEFYKAFYNTNDHENHSLGVGYEYNMNHEKFYPISFHNNVYISHSESFELTLQS